MDLHDAAMPGVRHLTGADAVDVLSAAVDVAGGTLHDVRASQVQYRPGTDLVVRYHADVTWADGRRCRDETLLAAAHPGGALAGTVPVVARADGGEVLVSVWRWPFDPVVVGLEDAVTPGRADGLIAATVGPHASIDVVAYRPAERAVVRLTGSDGTVAYLKAVPPADLPGLVDRHQRLVDAGLPVPDVLAADADRGLVLLRARTGTTLRERIKADLPGWPAPEAIADLVERVHQVDPAGLPERAGRVADAMGHAHLVATIAPSLVHPLEALTARFAAEAPAVSARRGAVVHGDLHEGQLVVGPDGAVTGLLDIDDIGVGDPVDDHATLIAHLRFRASMLPAGHPTRPRVFDHVRALRDHAAGIVGDEAIDVAVAAVLVGLATGPFRVQHAGWHDETAAVVADAASLVEPWTEMRAFSGCPHEDLTRGPHSGDRHPLP